MENEHTQILIGNLIKAQDEHTLGYERKSALDEFHKHLTGGIEKILDKVLDVVPCLQAILRRIVQEPRCSGTNLNYYKSNKEPGLDSS